MIRTIGQTVEILATIFARMVGIGFFQIFSRFVLMHRRVGARRSRLWAYLARVPRDPNHLSVGATSPVTSSPKSNPL
jgi:hypothetical protein